MSATGRILCFGEMLLRFSPNQSELLLQSPSLTVRPGGAEANVAVSLARFGAPTALASVLPDNALGYGVRDEARRHGVDVAPIVFRPGRMGLYFLTPGAVRRPSEVLYDRAGSAFAQHADRAFDWDKLLNGAAWLHVSGVTPAIGPEGAQAALAITEAAARAGVKVSFDGNFRGKLWSEWRSDPPAILRRIFENASLAFADERDFALVLGKAFDDLDPQTRRGKAADAAFAAFPRLERIACTLRVQDGVSDQTLSATLLTRAGAHHAGPIGLAGVIDRVGAGDAFAAGVLFGLWSGWTNDEALTFGLAASGLKHSVPGDFNLFSAADVKAAMTGGGFDIRR